MTPVTLARRSIVTRPADQLLVGPLPRVCAISGGPAQETLTARIRGPRAPLWLLFLGIVPYVVVRVLLAGGSDLRIEVPYAAAVARRLQQLQRAQPLAWTAAVMLAIVGAVSDTSALALLALVPTAAAVVAGVLASGLQVRPVLRDGLVQMSVSHQLGTALTSSAIPAAQP